MLLKSKAIASVTALGGALHLLLREACCAWGLIKARRSMLIACRSGDGPHSRRRMSGTGHSNILCIGEDSAPPARPLQSARCTLPPHAVPLSCCPQPATPACAKAPHQRQASAMSPSRHGPGSSPFGKSMLSYAAPRCASSSVTPRCKNPCLWGRLPPHDDDTPLQPCDMLTRPDDTQFSVQVEGTEQTGRTARTSMLRRL